MNIMDLLELDASASEREIHERALDKQRYFSKLAQSAPTKTLSDVYARRLNEIEAFLATRGHSPVTAKSDNGPVSMPKPIPAGIEFFLQADSGRRIELMTGLNIVGREPRQMGNPIVLDDDYVSKNHAIFEIVSGPPASVQIYDIGEISPKPSTNGVYLNDSASRVTGRVELRDGDGLRFGGCRFTLRTKARPAESPPPASSDPADGNEFDKTVIVKAPYR